jgi:hypothetical protein
MCTVKNEGTQDNHGRDGGTNFILRTKEQETSLKHDDDDDDVHNEVVLGCRSQPVTFDYIKVMVRWLIT